MNKDDIQRADDIIGHNVSGTESVQMKDEVKEDWVEDMAGSLWREIHQELLRGGVVFPNNFSGVGSAYGSLILIKQYLTQQKEAIEREWREKIEKTGKRLEIYCSEDTSRSVINMHGYNDGIKEIVKELLK